MRTRYRVFQMKVWPTSQEWTHPSFQIFLPCPRKFRCHVWELISPKKLKTWFRNVRLAVQIRDQWQTGCSDNHKRTGRRITYIKNIIASENQFIWKTVYYLRWLLCNSSRHLSLYLSLSPPPHPHVAKHHSSHKQRQQSSWLLRAYVLPTIQFIKATFIMLFKISHSSG